MRYRIKDYGITIDNGYVYVHIKVPNSEFLVINPVKEAIRLIVDETVKEVFCSSMQKDKIASITSSSVTGYDMAIGFAIPTGKTISVNDLFTVEMDFGDALPADYAKETSVSYNIQQVSNMQGYLQNTIAKEDTLGDVQDVLEYIEQGGVPEIGAIAKQGANANATLSEVQTQAISAANDTAVVKTTLGTSSDTSVSTTIFGWLKSIRDFLVGIVTTSPYAKESTAQQAATDAAAAKVAAQELSPIALAADAYNTGKVELAANITAKGVEASASETLPQLAQKVTAIAQQPIILSPSEVGDMYAVQQIGSLTTPNYWNLYEVLNTLLNDGRLLNYGGILLAEYYRGYDSLVLSGAGAGGAYVVSDMENGIFKMYTEDITHVWSTEFDGKGNRWVAYCFAEEYHDYQITDINTSPCGIFIGRKVGTITCFVEGRISQIVVPDGNELMNFTGNFTQNFGKNVVIRNIKEQSGFLMYNPRNVETIYIQADTIHGPIIGYSGSNNPLQMLRSVIVDCANIHGEVIGSNVSNSSNSYLALLAIKNCMNGGLSLGAYQQCFLTNLKDIIVEDSEEFICSWRPASISRVADYIRIYFGYKTNDKTKTFNLTYTSINPWQNVTIVELQDGWCKPVNISNCINLTEQVMFTYILQRLKQDEPDCGDGVTITLGSANLAKLTSAESVALLDSLTNIYGYTFA